MSKNRRPQGMLQDDKIRQETHLTTPPRLEGKVRNAMMRSPKKKKKTHLF